MPTLTKEAAVAAHDAAYAAWEAAREEERSIAVRLSSYALYPIVAPQELQDEYHANNKRLGITSKALHAAWLDVEPYIMSGPISRPTNKHARIH